MDLAISEGTWFAVDLSASQRQDLCDHFVLLRQCQAEKGLLWLDGHDAKALAPLRVTDGDA